MNISSYQLKKGFQNLLRPIANQLIHFGCTPNMVTVGTTILSIVYAVLLWAFASPLWFLSVPVFSFVRMALNAIDGMMAKEHGKITLKGSVLNEVTDVFNDVLTYTLILYSIGISPILVSFFSGLSVMIEFVSILGALHGQERSYSGPLGKSDRAIVVSVFAILYSLNLCTCKTVYSYMMIFVLFLALVTIWNRVKWTQRF